jgi:hypothetical protein
MDALWLIGRAGIGKISAIRTNIIDRVASNAVHDSLVIA